MVRLRVNPKCLKMVSLALSCCDCTANVEVKGKATNKQIMSLFWLCTDLADCVLVFPSQAQSKTAVMLFPFQLPFVYVNMSLKHQN